MKKHKFKFRSFIFPIVIVILVTTTWLVYLSYPFDHQAIQIGSSYMTMNNEFFPVVNDEVANYVDKEKSFLHNRDPDLSVNKQVEQIHSFMKKDVNAIILNPVDGNSAKLNQAISAAHKQGIKIIIVDSQVKTKNVDCTIISDNYRAGQLCAKQLIHSKKIAKILIIEQTTANSAIDRINGFIDTIKKTKNPNYKIVGRLNTNGQSETAFPLVKKFIAKKIPFNAVMALNDKTAVGDLAAIDSSVSKSKTISVYSVDGSKDIKQIIGKNKNAAATVAQSPFKLGQIAVKTAYKLIDGKKVPKKIVLPVRIITNRNINKFDTAGWQ